MTLAFIQGLEPVEWTGQTVNGVNHPPNIEALWSDQELRDAGLYRIVDDPIPDGMMPGGNTIEMGTDGIVHRRWTDLSPVPKLVPPPISKLQFYRALALIDPPIISRADALAAIRTGAIPPVATQVVASLDADSAFLVESALAGASQFARTDPFVPLFARVTNPPLTDDQIDAIWDLGATL